MDLENVVVVALKFCYCVVKLLHLVFRELRFVHGKEDAFSCNVLVVIQIADHFGKPASGLIGHLLRLARSRIRGRGARLRLVRGLLRRLGSLAGRSGLAVRFHRAFIYARHVVFNIADRRRLFRRPLLNRTDACFDWPYGLSDVFLCRATRCETRTSRASTAAPNMVAGFVVIEAFI